MLNSWATQDMGLGGAYHCGVEVLGSEWTFQGSASDEHGLTGVMGYEPKTHRGHIFRETINLGNTPVSVREVGKLLFDFGEKWPASSYHFLYNNCTDFSAAFVAALQVPYEFPEWVHGVAKGPLVQQALRADNTWALPRCGYAAGGDDVVLDNATFTNQSDLHMEAELPS